MGAADPVALSREVASHGNAPLVSAFMFFGGPSPLQLHQVNFGFERHLEATPVSNINIHPESPVIQKWLRDAADDRHLAPQDDTSHSQLINEIRNLDTTHKNERNRQSHNDHTVE